MIIQIRHRNTLVRAGLFAITAWMIATLATPAFAQDDAPLGPPVVIATFLDHVAESGSFEPSAKAFVQKAWAERPADMSPVSFIPEALAVLSPRFKQGLDAMDEERYPAAEQIMHALAEADDPYLSLHAAAFELKSIVYQNRVLDGSALAEQLYAMIDRFEANTYLAGEITYLRGYCQLQKLEYEQAAETLAGLGRRYPEAPERLRMMAEQMTREIISRQEGSLGDVSDLMRYAGRELGHGRYEDDVAEKQEQAVALLDELIKQAEQQEQSGGGGGGGAQDPSSPRNQAPQQGANRSEAIPSPYGTTRLHDSPAARPGEMWGQMRPAEREAVLQPIRESFPGRYLELLEQYYRELSK